MSDILPLRQRPTLEDRTSRVGMIVFVAGWTMMFGALLIVYLSLRSRAPGWPPPGLPTIERGLPSIATGALLSSSATLQLGLHAIRNARPIALRGYLLATLLLGLSFLALQIASWVHMAHRGLRPTESVYASCFFGLTAFHAVHVLVGLGGLVSLWPRAARGAFSVRAHGALRGWSQYWHFMAFVWIVFFAAVYW
jgi:cytochrome c oxidase subunit 3